MLTDDDGMVPAEDPSISDKFKLSEVIKGVSYAIQTAVR